MQNENIPNGLLYRETDSHLIFSSLVPRVMSTSRVRTSLKVMPPPPLPPLERDDDPVLSPVPALPALEPPPPPHAAKMASPRAAGTQSPRTWRRNRGRDRVDEDEVRRRKDSCRRRRSESVTRKRGR